MPEMVGKNPNFVENLEKVAEPRCYIQKQSCTDVPAKGLF